MPKFHIHVYRVIDMWEFDIEAADEEEAKGKALDHYRWETPVEPDCNYLAIIPLDRRRKKDAR